MEAAKPSHPPLEHDFPQYIAVEGPVGVGKTTLARRLASTFNYDVVLEEPPRENPFLERFYRHPRQVALATQLHFLFQRASQLQTIQQKDMFEPVRVSDFCMEKDRLFAEMYLDQHELQLYNRAWEMQTRDLPKPDLVIYLQAPVDVLKDRIRERGIEAERLIGNGYLKRLNEAYARFFHYYEASPLLIVNAAEIDLVHSEQDYSQLVEEIMICRKGRHYFNPKPSEL
ncbi:deoxynucleoside kinase [Sansalvadorimonas sp. 2012CJ34-2]|uniref:Deoxynucleoside kinase n=1 Tax=Parendozoicomonas callyspongiae TaxID=2942213 RepID=A0ABT0PK56_9GAMM|nr:deoxynucleoside kinase [Sansalvadorimonas sp. 2012CJ34-2]MCL6271775.1 deoxynucleoside kinase [Sansalvadorimonas sp. 2012CJ34-2]